MATTAPTPAVPIAAAAADTITVTVSDLAPGEEVLVSNGTAETVAPGGEGKGEGSSAGLETLEKALELFEKGSKALEAGDAVEAADCLGRALEIRVAHHGELAPECCLSYYRYGCALLFKAQEEADPLVDVPKKAPKSTGEDKARISADESGNSKNSVSDSNQDALPKIDEVDALTKIDEMEEDGGDVDQDDADDGSDDENEDTAEADEEDSDLDMAWKMLELARAVAEKQPEDSIEKANILSALGETSAEREDTETSLNDYLKALSMLERLFVPDHRRIVELNFRISLVLEMASKVEEAIPYCSKAISLCNSRIQHLKEDSSKADPPSDVMDEIEQLKGILPELERKLEDMQQSLSNPIPDLSEIVTMVLAKVGAKLTAGAGFDPSSSETRSMLQGSSQLGVNNGGFDSSTGSTAATNGSVTHLGVIGRGAKRANVSPSIAEPSPKRSSLDTTAAKDESSVSEVVNSTHDTGSSE